MRAPPAPEVGMRVLMRCALGPLCWGTVKEVVEIDGVGDVVKLKGPTKCPAGKGWTCDHDWILLADWGADVIREIRQGGALVWPVQDPGQQTMFGGGV